MSLKEVKIRLAIPSDIDELVALVGEYHAFESIQLPIEQRKPVLNTLLEDTSLGFIIVAVIDDELVAYLAICYGYSIEMGGRDAFVDECLVCEEFRGNGIGSKLLEQAKQFSKNHEVKALHLETTKTNDAAKIFYQKQGFLSRDDFHLMTYHL